MEDFKQYLSDDPDASEQAAVDQIREGLTVMRLEQKVAEVAVERQRWLRQGFWKRIIVFAALVIVSGVAVLFFLKKNTPEMLPPGNTKEQPGLQDNQQNIPLEAPGKQEPIRQKNVPMADNRQSGKVPSPRFPAPNIRGENTEDKAWQTLLDKIWYTDYPPVGLTLSATFAKTDQLLKSRDFNNAYVQLQRLERNLPTNDTLRFLKGYCLMEMGEGAEALTYFEKLESTQPSWEMQLQWYSGLSLLLTGDKEKALTVFRKIAATSGHPFREQSKHAIRMLE